MLYISKYMYAAQMTCVCLCDILAVPDYMAMVHGLYTHIYVQ